MCQDLSHHGVQACGTVGVTADRKEAKVPISEHKTRIAITVDDVLLAKMDAYINKTRQTRSQYICGLVGRELATQETVLEGVMGALQQVLNQLTADAQGVTEEQAAQLLGIIPTDGEQGMRPPEL
jgi:hypothetical protein